jgi:hypothetical protein
MNPEYFPPTRTEAMLPSLPFSPPLSTPDSLAPPTTP